ncbi:hypothetical protein [Micromonospora sp.]|uniref:hypothetical protein n=1 Tax=Micromonospora sp. TaxID=1876 RepID=UPI003B3B1FA7
MASVALAALTYVASWFWIGQGPGKNDSPAQIAGCAISLIVIAVVASLFLHPALGALIGTLAFTAAWSVHASATDPTGLWPVGAMIALVGVFAGWILVAGLTFGLRTVVTRRRAIEP